MTCARYSSLPGRPAPHVRAVGHDGAIRVMLAVKSLPASLPNQFGEILKTHKSRLLLRIACFVKPQGMTSWIP